MSVLAERVLTVARPMGSLPYCVWIPFIGALWVVVNVMLIGLGTRIPHPMICSFLAGIINGTILSVIAVALASDRFQAGTTGLLGGLSLSGLRNDGSMIWKAMQGLHGFVDGALVSIGIGDEELHRQIGQETLYIVWTTIFVVMASLVAEWVRCAQLEK
jgi:hypothetical protein